jgi:hypothetical protein
VAYGYDSWNVYESIVRATSLGRIDASEAPIEHVAVQKFFWVNMRKVFHVHEERACAAIEHVSASASDDHMSLLFPVSDPWSMSFVSPLTKELNM